MSLGAYFGSTKIIQGAGGLGQGPLQAYSDGVFARGDRGDAETPGALFAFHDGSLGSAPLQAYADGSVGGGYDYSDGTLASWDNGVLGSRPAVEYETAPGAGGAPGGGGGSSDGGSLGPGAGGGGMELADHPERIQSYQDGVFGGRGTCGLGADDDGPTPISVFDDGILGRPFGVEDRMYGGLRSYHDGSLGADAPTPIGGVPLDLGDEATLAQVKSLILMLAGTSGWTQEQIQKNLPPDWVNNGLWDAPATQLWNLVTTAIPQLQGQGDISTQPEQGVLYPTGKAISILVAAMGDNAKAFPLLFAWHAAGDGPVQPPYLSLEAKARGTRGTTVAGMSAGKMAMWGLGAAALLGIALVASKKR